MIWEIAAVVIVALLAGLFAALRSIKAQVDPILKREGITLEQFRKECEGGLRCPQCLELYVGLEEDCKCTGVIYR